MQFINIYINIVTDIYKEGKQWVKKLKKIVPAELDPVHIFQEMQFQNWVLGLNKAT